MAEVVTGFEELKISALGKSFFLNCQITNMTLGPHSNEVAPSKSEVQEIVSVENPEYNQYKLNYSLPFQKLIHELEHQRQEKVQQAINSHIDDITRFSKEQGKYLKEEWMRQKQDLIKQQQQQEFLILQALEQHDKDISEQREKLVQYYQDLADRRKTNDLELKAREKRKQQISAIIDKIKKDQLEFRSVYQEINMILKKSTKQQKLKVEIKDIIEQLRALTDGMEEIINRCKANRISENEIKKSAELVELIKNYKNAIEQKVMALEAETVEIQREEEVVKPIEIPVVPVVPVVPVIPVIPVIPVVPVVPVVPVPVAPSPVKTNKTENSYGAIEKYISKSSFHFYLDLQQFLQSYSENCDLFIATNNLKTFRCELTKVINTVVNTISATNPRHLLDKYNRLSRLLAGDTVEIAEVKISAAQHPLGISFCTHLLSKQLVSQGNIMISSQPEAAFAYAAIIVALWNDFPDFGKLILAQFHKCCPYLVPWYPPKAEGLKDEEYYRSLGYAYTDGVVEKHDKFLTRMTGIMRLYAAIVITRPKQRHKKNPHGLSEAWRWLGATLNLEPRMDITATMIHTFLETVGLTMLASYGKSFKKIINFISFVYLPQVKKSGQGGPITRLEGLLISYNQTGTFQEPRGVLPNNFW